MKTPEQQAQEWIQTQYPQELARLRAIEEAVKPFVNIVKHSVGRIPVEKLSLSDWHELCKAAKAITAPEDKEDKV